MPKPDAPVIWGMITVKIREDLLPVEEIFYDEDFEPVKILTFSDIEILKQNTSSAGRWLAKSGTKNPYREGALGVIEEGAYADLLLVDGNPLEDVSLVADWENNLKLIMKDGKVFKNTL